MSENCEEQKAEKYYRVQANVDLGAIRHNLLEIKKNIKTGTKLMAIIKADAYGHGAVKVAEAVDDITDAYGVAIIEEAVELRKAGITKPILILGYTAKEQNNLVVAYDITQTVFRYEMAEALSEEAKMQGKKVKLHIKLETGMSRIGFSDTMESINEIKRITKLPYVEIEGIFTHFATADEKDKTKALNQLNRYIKFNELLEKEHIYIPVKHIANSAGIIDFPQANYNMVRSGIITYGIYPSDEVDHQKIKLIPAMELKTHVVYIKEVDAGVGVSYGATFVTNRKTRIATIPVGYADGYNRNLSNTGKVIIHGQYAPIIGRICMDQFMVDISGLQDVKLGDVVTLMGRDGDACIPVEEISGWAHSFSYELVCMVGKRVPRVYSKTKYE